MVKRKFYVFKHFKIFKNQPLPLQFRLFIFHCWLQFFASVYIKNNTYGKTRTYLEYKMSISLKTFISHNYQVSIFVDFGPCAWSTE